MQRAQTEKYLQHTFEKYVHILINAAGKETGQTFDQLADPSVATAGIWRQGH